MSWKSWIYLALVWGFGAFAETGRPPLVVMDLEPKGAIPLQAEAATQSVVRGIRDLDVFQVLSTADVRQLLAIERNRQIMGSQNRMSDMAHVLGAEHVVVGTLIGIGDELQVELRLLDTAQGHVISQKRLGPVSGVEQLAQSLPGLAQELLAPILEEQQGTLVVRCSEEAAEVVLDDVLVGSTPMKQPLKVARGTHRLTVRKDGFIAQLRQVRVLPDEVVTESFQLMPSPDYAEAYKIRYGKARTSALLATAGAVLALGGAYVFDRTVTEPLYQRQFLPRSLALGGTAQSDLPSSVSNDPKRLATYQQCGVNQTVCRTDINGIRGQLALQQIITGGLVVLGVGSAGLATYLWFTGRDPNRYANVVAGVAPGPSPTFVLAGAF